MSVTVADLLTGLVVCPLYASVVLNEEFSTNCELALTRRYAATVFITASTLSVGFLAIDRMQHIRKLGRYKLGNKILYAGLVVVWIIPVGLPLIALASDKLYATVAFVVGVVALLIIIIPYVGLFVVLRKHGQQSSEEFRHVSSQREKKTAKTVIIIVTCYLKTFLPFLIEKILFATKHFENMDESEHAKIGSITQFLCFLSSAVNPVIYVRHVS